MKRKKLTSKMPTPKCDMPILPREMIFKSFAFEAVRDFIRTLNREANQRRIRKPRARRRVKK